MEPSKSNIKEFFKQKKSGSSTSKAKSSSCTSKKKSSQADHSASYGSDIAHGFVDLQDDYDEINMKLKQFDMNMAYGPCVGISRLERWQRAKRLGLNPPEEIEELLGSSNVRRESLWDGRV